MDIEVRGLRKSFGDRPVFWDLNLTFPRGEITVLTGENGAGKTTLLRMMMGLEVSDAGEIAGLPDVRSALFQEDRLLPDLSVLRNVALGCPRSPAREEILRHLEAVGLKEKADAPVGELSGGMARRAALVRALFAPSELVLLDEPFSNLDPGSLRRAAEYIARAASGPLGRGCAARTVVAVVHGDIFSGAADVLADARRVEIRSPAPVQAG